MAFAAKYKGTCASCGKSIAVGELISWNRRGALAGKVYHASCVAPRITGVTPEAIAVAPRAPKTVAVEKSLPNPVVEKIKERSKLRPTDHWLELLAAVLPFVHRVLLIGAPGTGKSTAAVNVAGCKHRLTMTETTSEDSLLGMWHLQDGKTVWLDGPITQAMKNGESVLIDEVDRYSPEAASLMYSIIDDAPHVETPEGSVSAAKGYKMIMTANENLDTLPVAVQDRIEVIIRADSPAPGSLEGLPNELQATCGAYYRAIPKSVVSMKPTVRRVRTYQHLVSSGFTSEVAAFLVFGDNREILSVVASVASLDESEVYS
jgi:MoxR-like ATPase